MDYIIAEVSRIAQKENLRKVVFFGSRARGDNNERSDIDLAVYTDDIHAYNKFLEALDKIDTILKFDVT